MKNKKVIKRKRNGVGQNVLQDSTERGKRKALQWLRVTSTSPASKAMQTKVSKLN